ncbi:FecR domain-containing protein [Phocaeicola abscessus]|uniref:FecR domain-containing protein n=1 Tax=Phocaeicola abscessus TaxID=555313 RepID=UPI0018DE66B3|nr:FecR domain-containing protein [Phocaeicola abscessus]
MKNEGIFDFTGILFGQLLERLELWYDVKFAIKRKNIVAQVYTGKFDFKIIDERHIEVY